MSAGSGYQYLLRSVASGDGNRGMSTPLTRYYSQVGTPPGRWLGSGLRELGGGRLEPGMEVTEEQLARLIGAGKDPITGDQLGRAYPTYKPLAERVKERIDALDPEMTLEDRAEETARIEAEEIRAGRRQPVAGFDLTFSVPKSVSVLWGVADAPLQERIVQAHHAAVADAIDFFEREVAATRTGVAAGDGAVAQVEVAGVAAVAYDHYDSRSGDPQLHTHVVVSNKVMSLLDGRWRSLDGRPVFASVAALSAHYNALLADHLARDLGVRWELRLRGADRNAQWELVGVGDDLIREFSSRSREIDIEKDRLIAAYRAAHGRMPSEKKIVELRAHATLATRPPKQIRSLADLTTEWRHRASVRMGQDAARRAASIVDGDAGVALSATDMVAAAVEAIGLQVVAAVSERRATWTHWNLVAEASRQTMDLRFATTSDREAAIGMIVDAAKNCSVALTPPELAATPQPFQRSDGTSVFRPKHSEKYSSQAIVDAEARLLELSQGMAAPTVSSLVVDRVARRDSTTEEQRRAIHQVATSGRVVDLLVGPAGAGKTTTMRALRHAWITEYGTASVIGLAPSATAAQALADDLEIACDNTAKWLLEHDRDNPSYQLIPGQLVILDEATLIGTHALDRITRVAAAAGAKVLLVGDPHQLQSVDAGGAFALLVDRREDPPSLNEIHRFTHDWEKDASLRLRRGQVEVISSYAREDRIRGGGTDQMLDAAYTAWRADQVAGKASILVTESTHAVRDLNERARAERLALDGADPVRGAREVDLANGVRASVGDIVITRRNDRALRTTTGGWVKNGDRWRISDVRKDRSVVVRRHGPFSRRRHGSVVLPTEYAAEHLDLGYATTAHQAQGITVDSAHVVVTSSATRENLYVSMTRGRETNIAYVALDQPDDGHTAPEPEDVSARTILYGVMQHSGASLSAHQTIESGYVEYSSIARLAAELETIAAAAQHDRFADLIRGSCLSPDQQAEVLDSSAFGPLSAALRRAEANHHDLDILVPKVIAHHHFATARDIAAVLTDRMNKVATRPPRGKRRTTPRMVAGFIPEPLGPMSGENRQAIADRKELIEFAAAALAQQAIAQRAAWTRRFGAPPSDIRARRRWLHSVSTAAAYRDRYRITSIRVFGERASDQAQEADRQCAMAAVAFVAHTLDERGGGAAPSRAIRAT